MRGRATTRDRPTGVRANRRESNRHCTAGRRVVGALGLLAGLAVAPLSAAPADTPDRVAAFAEHAAGLADSLATLDPSTLVARLQTAVRPKLGALDASALHDLMIALADAAFADGRFATGLALGQAVVWHDERSGAPPARLRHSLERVGGGLFYLGRYDDAVVWFARSVALVREMRPFDGRALASAVGDLGVVLDNAGRYSEAAAALQEAVDTAVVQDPPVDAVDMAGYWSNLAGLQKRIGRPDRAEQAYLRAIALLDTPARAPTPSLATIIHNLGVLYDNEGGRQAESEALYRRALALRLTLRAADHPDIFTSYSSLAGFLDEAGRYGEAAPLHEKALAVARQRWGEAHPYYADELSSQARALRDMGRAEEGLTLARAALALREKGLGPNHVDVALSCNELADFAAAAGDVAGALALNQRAATVVRTSVPSISLTRADIVADLAGSMAVAGDGAGALTVMREAGAAVETRALIDADAADRSAGRLAGEIIDRYLALVWRVAHPEK